MIYHGIAGSSGIAIAKAYVQHAQAPDICNGDIAPECLEYELQTLSDALSASKQQIAMLRDKALAKAGSKEAQIFEAHLMILEDAALLEEVKNLIREQHKTAGYAIDKVIRQFVDMFSSLDDEYMRERAADIKDVGDRLLRNALGLKPKGFEHLNSEVIIIADELTPSDTVTLDIKFVKGFAVNTGGRTSHAAIMARTLEIPAVLGLTNITGAVNDGDLVILDGLNGLVIVNPDKQQIEEYTLKLNHYNKQQQELKKLITLPAVTGDGRQVEIAGNVGKVADIDGVLAYGGDGVGLYRTEFLYMQGESLPSEDQQFEAYKTVAEKLNGKPLIIRTLDIGGDKEVKSFEIQAEMNPFLGWRAIRISLACPELFKTQLRAILRASAYGNIWIMYPMISGVGEVRQANAILCQVKDELRRDGVAFNDNIKVGVMIEIPSAALTADIIVKEVDFFSIGTNDLCQYTLAVDRMNEKVANLYQPFHPAVLRLIKNVIDVAHRYGKPVGMCGEMAGDPMAALILLGLGLDEFSMSASSMLTIKDIIRKTTYAKARQIAADVMEMESTEEILVYIEKQLAELGLNK